MEEVKNPNEAFKALLDEKANQETISPELKRPRGRPKGYSPLKNKVTDEQPVKKIDPIKTVPPPVENESFTMMIMFGVNGALKPKHPQLLITKEEAQRLSVPYWQLYQFYVPDANGIYAVWANALIQTAVIVIAKIQIAKEILNANKPREESQTDTGNQRDGQVDQSQGTTGAISTNDHSL